MGKPRIDMTGWVMKEHGVPDSRLTCIEYLGDRKWKCLCECGKEVVARGDSIRSGDTKSCGCLPHYRFIDMTGWVMKEHGVPDSRWTILEYAGKSMWRCLCECGNEKLVYGRNIRSGESKSCGCLRDERTAERSRLDLTGQRFGLLVALEPTDRRASTNVIWKCQCDCGNFCEVSSSHLMAGNTRSCGCLGDSYGEYCCKEWLKNKNILYFREYIFSDLLSSKGYPLKFDFAIFENEELKCLIEYQGEQHYNESDFGKQQREETDPLKRAYCKEHNIPLYEIRYDEDIEERLEEIFGGATNGRKRIYERNGQDA